MTDPFTTVVALANALATRQISSVELTQRYLDRADRATALNAYITLLPDAAMAAAAVADQQLAAGDAHPLCGIPLAHKDIFCTKNQPTTCGSKMLANFCLLYTSDAADE